LSPFAAGCGCGEFEDCGRAAAGARKATSPAARNHLRIKDHLQKERAHYPTARLLQCATMPVRHGEIMTSQGSRWRRRRAGDEPFAQARTAALATASRCSAAISPPWDPFFLLSLCCCCCFRHLAGVE